MRKAEREQLLELINTMGTVTDMMESILASGDNNAFFEILSGQQEAAISIGTKLEKTITPELSGEEQNQIRDTVKLLELYCELLWNIHNMAGSTPITGPVQTLREALDEIENAIKEMPVRLEIVFLPYKASMWDCMETVWMAAKEDPQCDVYVVPIPYYDLNPDGSTGDMHYEGNLMPKKVPVMDFRKYNIEKRRPDVIYIHNPYDEYNKVTRVHPDYYSSRLCNYTDMLVYIPYFLLGEHLAETHSLLPAYVYADKIVLSAETMMDDIDPSIPREKFIVAGSTKAERLVWMQNHKEELDVPLDWKRKIEGKKVVFYNLSVSGLLKHREKMLAKMEEVFSVFEKRDDVVMLYRPHPLIESTLKSMCPELLKDYQILIKHMRKMKNSIYDTTPDAAVAVVLSDAYVGESTSSIVTMFKVLNKPILYLDEKKYYQPTPDEMMADQTFDVCRVGDELWFVTHPLQILCKYSLVDHTIVSVAQLPEVENDGRLRYVNVVYDHNHNCLIMVPYRGEALCIYDLKKETFRKDYFRAEYVNSCFGRVFFYKQYLYLTPINYPAIVRYDTNSGEFTYFTECITQMYERVPMAKEGAMFVWGVDTYGNEIYLASTLKNLVLTFNMETGEYRIDVVGKDANKYRGMAVDDTSCWMILCDSPTVVQWNRKTGEVIEYSNFPPAFETGEVPFRNIINMDKELYLIPFQANQICTLNKVNGRISSENFGLPYKEGTFATRYFGATNANYNFSKKISTQEIVAMSCYDDSLIILDIGNKKHVKTPIRLKNRLQIEINTKKGNIRLEYSESGGMPIHKYLNCVIEELFSGKLQSGMIGCARKHYENIGAIIHTSVLDRI